MLLKTLLNKVERFKSFVYGSVCEKAGVKYFRFHPLRHAGASLTDSINIPLSKIQGILGHENRKTTEGYIHTTRGRSVEVMRAFEKAQESNA
ncbi:MAG: tyrosine-type recombinase/integrase [Pseudomonadota bacterium]